MKLPIQTWTTLNPHGRTRCRTFAFSHFLHSTAYKGSSSTEYVIKTTCINSTAKGPIEQYVSKVWDDYFSASCRFYCSHPNINNGFCGGQAHYAFFNKVGQNHFWTELTAVPFHQLSSYCNMRGYNNTEKIQELLILFHKCTFDVTERYTHFISHGELEIFDTNRIWRSLQNRISTEQDEDQGPLVTQQYFIFNVISCKTYVMEGPVLFLLCVFIYAGLFTVFIYVHIHSFFVINFCFLPSDHLRTSTYQVIVYLILSAFPNVFTCISSLTNYIIVKCLIISRFTDCLRHCPFLIGYLGTVCLLIVYPRA